MTTPTALLDPFDTTTKARVTEWLTDAYDEATKAEIQKLLKENPQEITDSFYKTLTFGTGGLRATMGVGTNRLNTYTIATATQGLANYLKQQFQNQKISVFISYDSRHHSRQFAEETALVLAGSGIHVYLTREIRPTPFVSFGCRYKTCQSAVMITASHNPPEYNGYKVYWSDGGQVLPPHDMGIQEEIQKITSSAEIVKAQNLNNSLIEFVEDEVDDAYLESIKTLSFYPDQNVKKGSLLKIVYTSLHGTGITLVPRTLKMWGFTSISYVDQQIIPDGNFPTVHFPNPEEKEALTLGINGLVAQTADILLATDPDADRVGVVVMHDNQPHMFTGNQIACICLEHICNALVETNKLNASDGFLKTIMTTELFKEIARRYEVICEDTLPGFKYIAERIRTWEKNSDEKKFIFGGEESYGYLLGTYSRDKDAVVSSALIAEVALHAKLQGKTLVDLLHDLHNTYGIYFEKIASIPFSNTKEGMESMKVVMQKLRANPFNEIEGYSILAIDDYLILEHLDLKTQEKSPLTFENSDILVYWFENGSKLMVRPSGTEPKIKIYCSILQKEFDEIEAGEAFAEERANELLEAVKELLTENSSSS